MKGVGTDEAPIVEILARRCYKQREEIAQTYKREFGRVSSWDWPGWGGSGAQTHWCVK